MKELKPVPRYPDEADKFQALIVALFKTEIYIPLMKALGAKMSLIKNAKSALADAIASGQIHYAGGRFTGQFNAAISKELKRLGAKWVNGGFRLALSDMPSDISMEIRVSAKRFQQMADQVNARIDEMVPEELAGMLDFGKLIDQTMYRSGKDFDDNVKAITVTPELSAEARARIAAEYTSNVQLAVVDIAQAELKKLRDRVNENAQAGVRYDELVQEIVDSYGLSQTKAKFLARQETNLLVTKLAQVRYEAAGVPEYRWQCVAGSAAHPVRPMHKNLDGKVFRWDAPPIVDENGNRKNPGQDYNCRCRAVPVVKF